MITIIPIEPLSQAHALLIIEAFNSHFINGGGPANGWGKGYGYGYSNGGGWSSGGKCPEAWIVK